MKIKSFLASFLAIFILSMSGAWADSVVNPIDQALENQGYFIKAYALCTDKCELAEKMCLENCSGKSDERTLIMPPLLFSDSPREKCEGFCRKAYELCVRDCN